MKLCGLVFVQAVYRTDAVFFPTCKTVIKHQPVRQMEKTMLSRRLLACLLWASTSVYAQPFSIGLWGDMPYARNDDADKIPRLIASMNAEPLAFTVFDGDSKDGSTPCIDERIGKDTAALFSSLKHPTIYVLGDNEWSDCHRLSNGGYHSLERLAYLRKNLFADDFSFGQNKLKLQRQEKPYVENSRWQYGGVMFVGLNVPGGNNNKVNAKNCPDPVSSARTQKDCDAANAEYLARDVANNRFLQQAFVQAKADKLAGVMVIIQADPGFDLPETPVKDERQSPNVDGYNNFLATLIEETEAFAGQVVLVHGDTHSFKIDKPLHSPTRLLKNFSRVQTFGSPHIHWVKATIDTTTANVFSFEPVIVLGN